MCSIWPAKKSPRWICRRSLVRYLGRRYRLKIDRYQAYKEIKLTRGFFHIQVKDSGSPEQIKQMMDSWYADKTAMKFQESFDRCWQRFNDLAAAKPLMVIRRMKKRWSSLSKNGRLTLNTDLIQAPKDYIDYVITHELCHLRFHDHGPNFCRLLEHMMPDWERRISMV